MYACAAAGVTLGVLCECEGHSGNSPRSPQISSARRLRPLPALTSHSHLSPMSAPASFPPTLTNVQVEDKGSYAIVTLNRAPVNGMNLSLWSDLLSALDACESTSRIRGIIIASGLDRDIFTAGNDLRELYSKTTTQDRFSKFWRAQTTCLTRLYTSRLATVAAIRGACPAGGCITAMCCDYRLMTSDVPGATLGLNEVALGISVPRYWVSLYKSLLGTPRAELSLLTGKMFTPEQGVAGGLLHQLCTKASLMADAEKAMATFLRNPDAGRIATKRDARAHFAKEWQDYCEEEARQAWTMLSSPPVTAALAQVLARLSGGAAAAGAGAGKSTQAKAPRAKL